MLLSAAPADCFFLFPFVAPKHGPAKILQAQESPGYS